MDSVGKPFFNRQFSHMRRGDQQAVSGHGNKLWRQRPKKRQIDMNDRKNNMKIAGVRKGVIWYRALWKVQDKGCLPYS